MNISSRLAAIFALATASAAHAATAEQAQALVQRFGIPQWQRATAQIKALKANPPNTAMADAWKSLDAETDTATGKAPLARATTPQSADDLMVLSSWLRWRILSENADPRYSYAYAANLHYMRDAKGDFRKEAATFFYHARLALAIDGARCVDRASPDSVAVGFETQPYFQPLVSQVTAMSGKEKGIAMLEAVSLEQLRGERPALGALCSRGAQSVLRAMASGRQPELQKPDGSSSAPATQQKTYTVDVSGIEPSLVPEDQWKQKRTEILNKTLQDAAGLL